MKNFILIFTILISALGFANGQNCNDLIITELVFGDAGSALTGASTQFNHSVEVYNPTDVNIDLANYLFTF